MRIQYLKPSPFPRLWGLHWAASLPVRKWERSFGLLADLETRILGDRIPRVDDPIFICGLARSGTTVTLELLARHDETASFCYADMMQPYLPYMWHRFGQRFFKGLADRQERPHGDGLMMAPDLPEAVEEVFWLSQFPWIHDEVFPGLLGRSHLDGRFNRFYRCQLGKLLLARGKRRYLAKANYHVTRLPYLQGVFESPRILILVRHPFTHAVSYLKQHQRLSRLYRHDVRWWKIAKALGHYEFGEKMQFIHTGDAAEIRQIRRLWDAGCVIEAFARYWRSVYEHLYRTVSENPVLSEACLFVRYEDLCLNSDIWIDRILDHCHLNRSVFSVERDRFSRKLGLPRYYQARLASGEKKILWQITEQTAERFDYLYP